MPPLSILTWNVQNLGRKKESFEDIITAIARVVSEVKPDIFILLEVNTTAPAVAAGIGETVQAALKAGSDDPGREWNTYAVSPPTGVEFYGFFIRHDTRVRPVVPVSGTPLVRGVLAEPFETRRALGVCQFPLVEPDLVQFDHHHPAQWTGARLPCLAMFRFDGYYLPIMAGHFAANEMQASAQIEMLPCFDLLAAVCNPGAPGAMTLDGRRVEVRHAVVTGDFNVHFDPADYPGRTAVPVDQTWDTEAAITAPGPPPQEEEGRAPKRALPYAAVTGTKRTRRSAQMLAVIEHGTLLARTDAFAPRRMHDTRDLAERCIDNFLVSTSIVVERHAVLDVPGMFRWNRGGITLPVAVPAYAAAGMKSFNDDPTEPVVSDFARQLAAGSPTTMGLGAALAGARLISDHLPVVMVISLT